MIQAIVFHLSFARDCAKYEYDREGTHVISILPRKARWAPSAILRCSGLSLMYIITNLLQHLLLHLTSLLPLPCLLPPPTLPLYPSTPTFYRSPPQLAPGNPQSTIACNILISPRSLDDVLSSTSRRAAAFEQQIKALEVCLIASASCHRVYNAFNLPTLLHNRRSSQRT